MSESLAETAVPAITIHVLGSFVGESIILELPDGVWGVIDCFTHDLVHPQNNPTVRFLKDREVRKLAFVCLTHPHADHYRGMRHLCEEFEVGQFWRFGVSSRYDIRLMDLMRGRAIQSGQAEKVKNADELLSLLGFIRAHRRKHGGGDFEVRVANVQHLFPMPIPVAETAAVRITAFAPSSTAIIAYEESIHRNFNDRGELRTGGTPPRNNSISMGLVIEWSDSRCVLGGDVEKAGWNYAIRMLGSRGLLACGVKVSHHGSTTGYTDGLWATFAGEGRPIAIVTPFCYSHLPTAEALDHIGSHAQLFTTHLQAVQESRAKKRKTQDSELLADLVMRAVTRCTRRVQDNRFGRCSVSFDHSGKCIQCECDGPADSIMESA